MIFYMEAGCRVIRTAAFSIFSILLCCLALSCQAQSWEVEKGVKKIRVGPSYETIEVPEKSYFRFEDQLVSLKKEDQELYFQCFDIPSLKLKEQSSLELEDNKMVHEATVQLGGELYFLYAWWDDDKEEERLFARKLDRKDCELGPSRKIFSYGKQKIHGRRVEAGFLGMKTVDKFDFYTSRNDRKLMVQFRLRTGYSGKNTSKVGFLVFDDSLQLEWKGVYKMPYPKGFMDLLSYCVTPKGEVYALAHHRESKVSTGPFHYHLFKFTEKGADLYRSKFGPEGIFAKGYNVTLKHRSKDELIFAGLYTGKSGPNVPDRYKGIFTYSIDPSGSVDGIHRNPFSKELIARYEEKDKMQEIEKKGMDDPKIGIKGLELLDSYLYDNGDLLIIGEQHLRDVSSTQRGDFSNESSIEYFRDLVVARVSSNGNMKWIQKLPKQQVGEYAGLDLSAKVFFNDRELQLLFFDNKDNLRLGPNEEPEVHKSRKKGYLTAYRVGHEKGDVTKTRILNIVDLKGQEFEEYSLSRFLSLGPKSFVFEVENEDGEDVLIKVKL